MAATRKFPETAKKLPAGGHGTCPLMVMGRGWGRSLGGAGGAIAPHVTRGSDTVEPAEEIRRTATPVSWPDCSHNNVKHYVDEREAASRLDES